MLAEVWFDSTIFYLTKKVEQTSLGYGPAGAVRFHVV